MAPTMDQVKAIWRRADCVCFDVDSTVCRDEAIDELAAFLGKGEEVASLTKQAMQGGMTYRESLSKRLDIMKPNRQDVTRFITAHAPKLTDGVKDLVKLLQSRKVDVYLISGGFTSYIEIVAEELSVPKTNLFANQLMFYYNGDYAGFDPNCPTSAAGGKPKVVQQLKDTHGYKDVVMIGDGITDLEASPPADAFVGFGGNIVRDNVKNRSAWFVASFQEMIDELEIKRQKIDS